jgi:ubiquinone/menaquinone biosynthesis C-methylase UbiE
MEDFLDPNQFLNQLDLFPDMVAADFGCGSGGWAIPLAKRLKEGKVYAIDILEEPLSVLKSRAAGERVLNLQVVRGNVEEKGGSKMTDSSMDLVLMTNLLFQVEDKKGAMAEAVRILKKGGRILVIGWGPESILGPKEGRISAKEVKAIAKEYDLRAENEFEAGAYHYGLILKKV